MKKFLLICVGLAVVFIAIVAFAAGGPATRTVGNGQFTNSLIVSSIPCKLYGVCGYNSTATNEFLMIFETNAVPANGTVCRIGPFPVGANQFFSVDFSFYGSDLDKCLVAMSTTSNSLTLAGTNFTIQGIVANQLQ